MNLKTRNVPRKIHLKKGDKAIIISGKDKGTIGEVLKVYPKSGKIIVEGVNIKTKHLKPRGDQKGQVVKVPSPVFSSKAMYYSEDKKAPSKLGRKILEDGTKARFMKKFKETI
ncbi:MAG TPA: 50S ribosomal protein L24 [Fusobacteria bacterium]|nr:50S ribosomal protein L24 [Fusobacteriota bacterium]|tara:strand:+ start:51621 stop:51959 length:339 start_codon:yes stop_codon:yes gene_type:complete